jgi:hypothetical protein
MGNNKVCGEDVADKDGGIEAANEGGEVEADEDGRATVSE